MGSLLLLFIFMLKLSQVCSVEASSPWLLCLIWHTVICFLFVCLVFPSRCSKLIVIRSVIILSSSWNQPFSKEPWFLLVGSTTYFWVIYLHIAVISSFLDQNILWETKFKLDFDSGFIFLWKFCLWSNYVS